MCGITGILNCHHAHGVAIVGEMLSCIKHRGPDDDGIWKSKDNGIILGHKRLAIIDLTPTGKQPMQSHCKRYTISYNGEVYNFPVIREELERLGHSFRGTSDTEVILAAFSQWGPGESLQKFNGMFAMALWDTLDKQLLLIRDRLGIKPLYYGWIDKSFVFASEIKAFTAHPGFKKEIDLHALGQFLRYDYVPTPLSIYKGINKLPPASILTVNLGARPEEEKIDLFWSARDVAKAGIQNQSIISPATVKEVLSDAVNIRMISDVPIGAFLSGGIDSSTISALAQEHSSSSVKTFTVGFEYEDFNEATYAKDVAQHLGTDHTEIYISAKEALDVIPSLPNIFSEPFADPSQIPTYLISKVARQDVTVCLSGDGGDELFAGYNRHVWIERLWRTYGNKPMALRKFLAWLLKRLSPSGWDRFAAILPGRDKTPQTGEKLYKIAGVITRKSADEIYQDIISTWRQPNAILSEDAAGLNRFKKSLETEEITLKVLFDDLTGYLPDDILTKIDRASMATSLEARVPMLDHRVVELAWRIPLSEKIEGKKGKMILRKLLNDYVPERLFNRPKSGFGVPLAAWLRNDLRDWAEDLLSEKKLIEGGYFKPDIIRDKWQQHLSGRRDWHYQLWNVLMFQAWLHD